MQWTKEHNGVEADSALKYSSEVQVPLNPT